MRDIPDANGGDGLRPVAAVALGALLLVGVFVVVTSGGGPAVTNDPDLRVEVTATPVDAPPSDADVRRHGSFEVATPVHRAVLRAASVNGTATRERTVESPDVVGLEAGAEEATFYVRRDSDGDDEYARVRVEVLERVEN
ncbi:hypothetical protein [Haloarcula litorea]|uniref:hypothetical protein n=1 Tax=Haloarcula litorea TaxID=3032579 RepID=UPI0023E855C3|nr:hypothetical protein [Halomicroarcula sp. GDY20]